MQSIQPKRKAFEKFCVNSLVSFAPNQIRVGPIRLAGIARKSHKCTYFRPPPTPKKRPSLVKISRSPTQHRSPSPNLAAHWCFSLRVCVCISNWFGSAVPSPKTRKLIGWAFEYVVRDNFNWNRVIYIYYAFLGRRNGRFHSTRSGRAWLLEK